MFDEVMGLGDFADSSRGSATSSRSGGQDETKGVDETSGQGEHQPVEEEDSNSSRQEEKMDEGMGESSFPRISSPSSHRHSSFTMGTNEGGGGGGSGGAAFDDALDGLPSYGPEEEDDEDWHFALPMGTLEDVHVGKGNRKRSQQGVGNNVPRGDPFACQPREEEEEQEREGSSGSANTSHSSQDHTPDNSRGTHKNLDNKAITNAILQVPILCIVSQYLHWAVTQFYTLSSVNLSQRLFSLWKQLQNCGSGGSFPEKITQTIIVMSSGLFGLGFGSYPLLPESLYNKLGVWSFKGLGVYQTGRS